ncbi:MAG: hypothetical protein HQL26_01620 [Candidatus Omnitrophica bacterium]|nr:hypothetical protein [Candidatus Omnitrophota bacterium]
MLKSVKRRGAASMVEVVITAVIFLIAAAGIMATTTMLRPKVTQSSSETRCLYAAKYILATFRTSIDATIWNDNSNPLKPSGTHTIVYNADSNTSCTINYYVVDDSSKARNIYMNVSWPN